MRNETLVLRFVRAHRENNFALYVEVLEELTHLFFALDHELLTMGVGSHQRYEVNHRRVSKAIPLGCSTDL